MYRILIADDEPIERKILYKIISEQFKNQNIVIEQAINGREAIELFEENKTDIVFLDIEMPGINGLEAAEKMREIDLNCEIIFLTAFDEFLYAKKAIMVNAMNYLLKPTSEDEIIAVLTDAICKIKKKESDKKITVFDRTDFLKNSFEKNEKIRICAVREEILHFIQEHYIEDVSLQEVAEKMHYSNAYFCKIFKQCFHKNFTTFLSEYRVEKAKILLVDVMINIKDIGSKVGYQDSNYFTKVFKKVVGITPSEYRILILDKENEFLNNRGLK